MAGFQTRIYDPDEFTLYLGGILIDGLADGEFVTVEMMSDAFQSVVGTDGEVARSKSNDRRAKVTFKLLQTSAANAALSALHNNDLNAPNGAGVVTLSIVDNFGDTKVQGNQAWITKFPDMSLDRSAKSREWMVEVGNVVRFEGGA
jgi:hypothetical protein